MTLTALVAVSASAQVDDGAVDAAVDTGCPSGAVCVYPDASWNGGNPSYVFWSYGVHRIYNQYGVYRVFNNQTDDATIQLCIGSDGTDCTYLPAGWTKIYDLTIINSVALQPT